MSYIDTLQKSIDFIEENLKEELTLEEISEHSYFSVPHFYRIFQIFTGYSIMDYVRKRRLSQAALELVNSKRRVIDISFEYNFESQEAFIRSFKRVFGITPGEYRKSCNGIGLFSKLQLAEYNINTKNNSIILNPVFFEKEFILLGLEAEINFSEDFTKTIIALQERLMNKLQLTFIPHASSRCTAYWYYKWDTNSQADEPGIFYFVGIEMDEPLALSFKFTQENTPNTLNDLELKKLPRSKYAIFDEAYRGEIAGPAGYAYKVWLPASGNQLNEAIPGDLEVYSNFTDIGPNSQCKIYIPIL